MMTTTDLWKAGDGSGTIYNVYRGPLIRGSKFFEGMLDLPQPGIPPMTLTDNAKEWFEKARKLGLDGTSDDLAVKLPPQLVAAEIEIFLDFMFLQGWSKDEPNIKTACAVLKISHFLAVNKGVGYAKRYLDKNDGLPSVEHLKLGFNYGFADWIKKAFNELMSLPVNDISEEDERIIGRVAYCALAKAQAKVLNARLNLAVCVPDVNHCNWCNNHSYCQLEWTKMWTSMAGVLGALIKEEIPGSQILQKLPTYDRGNMNMDCHRRTCDGLKDTLNKISILREEEGLIDEAVAELMRSAGIPSSK
ncbi:hypothetical protein K438DRAFT_1973150 [Mycena galopus ATCC 62051]|nr:hypothetical protein K438DRAFT_1973150 [Mycena galopus ATCC 62051]